MESEVIAGIKLAATAVLISAAVALALGLGGGLLG